MFERSTMLDLRFKVLFGSFAMCLVEESFYL